MTTTEDIPTLLDAARLKADFPILERTIDDNRMIYLDSAAASLRPRQVVDEISRYYLEVAANIHRGKHILSEEASVAYEEARYKVAQFIGCAGNEVVFTKNTTEALNLVAAGLGLNKTDKVVVCTDSHHSAYLPWVDRAETLLLRIDKNGLCDLDHYRELLKTGPRVVCLTHCSNVSGLYLPLAEMAALAKQAGALVVVDGAQSVPHRRIHVNTLDIDFLAFSSQKMLGPSGLGVLFGRKEHLTELNPLLLGGGMVDWVDTSGYRTRKIPHKFEAGTPHIAGAYGLAAAVKYLEKIGFDRLAKHDADLGRLLLDEAQKREYLEVIAPGTPGSDRCATISLKMRRYKNMGDIARTLSDSYGVMCRTGHMCAQPFVDFLSDSEVLRFSAYLYNTRQDILDAFRAFDDIQQVYKT